MHEIIATVRESVEHKDRDDDGGHLWRLQPRHVHATRQVFGSSQTTAYTRGMDGWMNGSSPTIAKLEGISKEEEVNASTVACGDPCDVPSQSSKSSSHPSIHTCTRPFIRPTHACFHPCNHPIHPMHACVHPYHPSMHPTLMSFSATL